MRLIFLIFAILITNAALSQNSLNIYDISQKELQIMQRYKDADSLTRNRVFIDSIYTPYKKFWNGYAGEADDVARWLEKSMAKLPEWLAKNKAIDGKKLPKQLRSKEKDMKKLTGYAPKGSWYIVYGPAWTDLGGLSDYAMLIDLAHASNSSNERIMKMFPHELTHQIMTNVNKDKDSAAISVIIGEGFAVWMNQKYWGTKFTLAQNLGYSEEELKSCDKNIAVLKKFFNANKYNAEKNIIDAFRNRGIKLNRELPGAVGYYIGYKIIESYVQKNGKDSWKDVFTKPFRQIYEESGFL